MRIVYPYPVTLQPETTAALAHLESVCPNSRALQSAKLGALESEPILIMMDSAIRYARAYKTRFDQPIGDDYMASDEFAGILKGIRALLDFDGAVAWERGIATDSKDNGMIESLYWTACEIAGIDGNL